MKKTIVLITLICLLFISVLQVKEQASTDFNVLFITNESAVSGDNVSDMISDIGRAYNITITNVKANNSLIEALTDSNEYTDVIIQDTYETLFNSNWGLPSSLNMIDSNINCYLGMPWKELTNEEKQTVKDKCQSVFGNSSLRIIERTYTNLLEVKNAGIDVANSNGTLTKAGELTLACTYITEIAKTQITGLTSYEGISEANVKTIIEKVNETISILEPSVSSTTNNTVNVTNTMNTANITNTSNTNTTKTTAKTTKKTTTAMGKLKADPMSFNYRRFKSDREPRLSFIKTDPDYIYIKFKDCGGIKCEHTGDTKNQPKVYTCDDATGKNKKEITDLKRCKKADYSNKQGTEYIYMVGIPSKYIGDKKSYFYVVGYDINSNVIREYISATRKKDGTYSLNRAPRSCAVTTDTDNTKIGFLTIDYTGVGTIKVRTIKNKDVDVLGQWDGTVQKNWSQVESVKANKMNVTSAITNMSKVSTFFKTRTWKGKNPKVKGKDGVYRFVVETKDAVGLSCVKTMSVNTNQIHTGNKYEKVANKKTTKKTSKKKSTQKTTKKTSSSSSKNAGYWEVKNNKYIYHYKDGTKKQFSKSCYRSNKKIQDIEALDPNLSNESKMKNWQSKYTYAGISHKYCVESQTANDAAKKNGTSRYAIVVDLNVANVHIYKRVGGTWIPFRTYIAFVGNPRLSPDTYNYNKKKGTKMYSKGNTPIGLFYIDGGRWYDAGDEMKYWVEFGVKGHNENNGLYLHYSPHAPKQGVEGVTGEAKGYRINTSCITFGNMEIGKWIYYHIGRGTPILIY